MTDPDNAPLHFEEEERLPWLEPIEEVDDSGASIGRLIGLVVAGLVGIGLIVGGLWWWQNHGGRPRGELIAAPAGPVRVPAPAEPGRFDGDGNVAVAAAEGVVTPGRVDTSKMTEQPVAPPAAAVAIAPAIPAATAKATTPAVQPAPATPIPVKATRPADVPTPAASVPATGTIQLGAFENEATAAAAWNRLKGRFDWLAPFNRTITPARVNGRTFYRLRAAAGTTRAAQDLCARLRVAGENCLVL